MMSLTRATDSRAYGAIAKSPTRAGYAPGINYSAPSSRTRQSGAIRANEYEYGIATPRAKRGATQKIGIGAAMNRFTREIIKKCIKA